MRTDRTVSSDRPYSGSGALRRASASRSPTELRLRGEYDAGNAHALRDQVARAIDADDADLVLHLADVTFLDASTLTVFINAKATLDREGRRFALCSLSIAAVRIVEICGLRCLVEDAFGTSQAS